MKDHTFSSDLILPVNDDLPLREVVFETLRRAILSGKLQPGERLMEIPLANQLGVSRTPVRDAIRMLELENLVVMIPKRGAVVAEITRSDLEDVLEVRMALEELAVRKACGVMTKDQLARLKAAGRQFADCVAREDLLGSAQADVAFHEIISDATGNRKLIQLLGNLREHIFRYRVENLKDKSTYPALVRQHQQIVEALEDGDEARAVQALHRHIEEQRISILETMRGKGNT